MDTLRSQQPIASHPFKRDEVTGSDSFTIARSEGGVAYESDVLLPHRKTYYVLGFVKHNRGRHWVDMTCYEHRDNTVYFSAPHQILVKEEPTPY